MARGDSGMTVQETSLAAFQRKKRNGTLQSDKEKVKYLIQQHGPITSIELQMWMQKPKHTFSGRITDLKEDNEIQVVGTKNHHQLYDIVEEKTEVEQPLLVDKQNGEVIAE
jgi:predicted HTH transcriptional regulator